VYSLSTNSAFAKDKVVIDVQYTIGARDESMYTYFKDDIVHPMVAGEPDARGARWAILTIYRCDESLQLARVARKAFNPANMFEHKALYKHYPGHHMLTNNEVRLSESYIGQDSFMIMRRQDSFA
jgi:hypothetical protein